MFEYGKLAEELTVFTDSDWAGCKETRKSSSAGVMMLGRHTLKACTQKQKVIAKSSAEAELYAAALGASEAKGVLSMMCDLGFAVKSVPLTQKPLSTFSTGRESGSRSTQMWRTCGYRTRSDSECAESGAKKTSQIWERNRKTVIPKHCLTLV